MGFLNRRVTIWFVGIVVALCMGCGSSTDTSDGEKHASSVESESEQTTSGSSDCAYCSKRDLCRYIYRTAKRCREDEEAEATRLPDRRNEYESTTIVQSERCQSLASDCNTLRADPKFCGDLFDPCASLLEECLNQCSID